MLQSVNVKINKETLGKSGGIITLSGGILITIAGIIDIIFLNTLKSYIFFYGIDFSAEMELLITTEVTFTFIFGLLGLTIGLMIFMTGSRSAAITGIVIGIIATVGMTVPIGYLHMGKFGVISVFLNDSLIYIDPLLITIGAILPLIDPENRNTIRRSRKRNPTRSIPKGSRCI